MKGLAESTPFHLLTNPYVINCFIFGHGVVIYYIVMDAGNGMKYYCLFGMSRKMIHIAAFCLGTL